MEYTTLIYLIQLYRKNTKQYCVLKPSCVFSTLKECADTFWTGGRVFLALLASRLKLSSNLAEIQNFKPVYQTIMGPCCSRGPEKPNITVVDSSSLWFCTKSICKWGHKFQAPSLLFQSILWMQIGLIVLSLYWLFFVCVHSPDRSSHTSRSCPALSRVDLAFIQMSIHRDRGNTGTMNLMSLSGGECFFFPWKNKCGITRSGFIQLLLYTTSGWLKITQIK